MSELPTVVALILVGFALIWLAKRLQLEFGEVTKTALILAPVILFLLLSGKLAEFEGLGWKAKFRSISAESILKAARTSDLATTSDQADPADFLNEAYWGMCRPYYLLTDRTAKTKDKPDELDKKGTLQIAVAIRNSIICGKFVALVILDDKRKPVGFFPRDQFLELLRTPLITYGMSPVDGDEAFKQVAASELGVILQNPVIRAQSNEANHNAVAGSEDIETVYKKLIAAGADTAVITDRLGRFDGIITRAAIEGKIIEGLLAASK
jgi:hypothetical protein